MLRRIALLKPELRGDDDLIADWLKRFAHDHFVKERPIGFGGVEKSDAPLEGLAAKLKASRRYRADACGVELLGRTRTSAAQSGRRLPALCGSIALDRRVPKQRRAL